MSDTSIVFLLDGTPIEALGDETILEAAARNDVHIPQLCYMPGLRSDGNCRACVVEIDGERVLAPSCCRKPTQGMKVQAVSDRATRSQRMVIELLLGDVASPAHDPDSELAHWARHFGIGASRYAQRTQPEPDFTHAGIEVRLDACIQCTRCVRACREVQVNDVIGYAYRGSNAKIVFDLDDPMGESTCVGCGECVQACPTGALLPSLPALVARDVARHREPPPQKTAAPPVPRAGGMTRSGMYDSVLMGNAYTQPQEPTAPAPEPELLATEDAPAGRFVALVPLNGAQVPAAGYIKPTSTAESLCPNCSIGCQATYHVADNHILRVTGRDGPSNHGRLCVKGRFGFDYVRHPQRLLNPLIRREGVPKDANRLVNPANPAEAFREADWDEALDFAAIGLRRIRDSLGPWLLAGIASAECSNEEAYLFQKLVRAGFGTNNVDHGARLSHASSDAALIEGLGSSAASNQVADVHHAECFIVIGADPAVSHPVAATFMKNAIERGTKLILIDPHRTELARHATHSLEVKPASDVKLLNAMLHTIITEDLIDREFIDARTSGFDELVERIESYNPETIQESIGIPADQVRAAARLFAKSRASMIFPGAGVLRGEHGTDTARCLIALALITGQIGRRGTGLHPLRGPNNAQGVSDMGLTPLHFPDYRPVEDADARTFFQELWGARALDKRKGLTAAGIMDAALKHDVRGAYIIEENPALSDTDPERVREALAALDWLVVQDSFLTETASFADVILPAAAFPEKAGTFTNTDRRVQSARAALATPGAVRQDLDLIQQMSIRMGLDWNYTGPADVWAEIRKAVPSCAGITWERLEREHSITYPCVNEGDSGDEVMFADTFPTKDGRARIMA